MRELGAGVDSLARQTLVPATATCEPTGTIHSAEPLSLGVFLLVGLLGGAHCLSECAGRWSRRTRTGCDPTPPPTVTAVTAAQRGPHEPAEATISPCDRCANTRCSTSDERRATPRSAGCSASGSLAFVTGRTVTTVADDVHALTGLVVGAVVIAIGVRYALRLELQRIPVPGSKPPRGRHRPDRPRIDAWVGNWRIVGLGAAHGLLPCPFAVPGVPVRVRAGQRARRRGCARRARLGTVPALFLFGTVFGSVSVDTRMRLHRALVSPSSRSGTSCFSTALATLGVPLPHPPIPYYSPL